MLSGEETRPVHVASAPSCSQLIRVSSFKPCPQQRDNNWWEVGLALAWICGMDKRRCLWSENFPYIPGRKWEIGVGCRIYKSRQKELGDQTKMNWRNQELCKRLNNYHGQCSHGQDFLCLNKYLQWPDCFCADLCYFWRYRFVKSNILNKSRTGGKTMYLKYIVRN